MQTVDIRDPYLRWLSQTCGHDVGKSYPKIVVASMLLYLWLSMQPTHRRVGEAGQRSRYGSSSFRNVT